MIGERTHIPFTMPCDHCGGCRIMLFAGVTLLAVLCLYCDMPDDSTLLAFDTPGGMK